MTALICPQSEYTPSTGPGFNQAKGKHSLPLTTIFVVFASKVARVQHPTAQEQRPDERYTHHHDDLQSFVRGREQRRKHNERIEGENAQPMERPRLSVPLPSHMLAHASTFHSIPQSFHARGLRRRPASISATKYNRSTASGLRLSS